MRCKPRHIPVLFFFFILSRCITANAALGDVIKSFATPNWSPRGLAWDGTFLWHADSGTNLIYKMNPANGAIISSFPTLAVNPWGISFVGPELWNYDGFSTGYYSVDPSVGAPWTLEFSKPTTDHYGIAYDGTYLWSTDINADKIDKMDLLGNIISSIPTPTISTQGIAWDGSSIWVTDVLNNTISKLNPLTGAVLQSFSSPSTQPEALTFDGTHLWIADYDAMTIYEVDAGFSSTPAPDGVTTLLVMFAGLGGWFGIKRLRFRFSQH